MVSPESPQPEEHVMPALAVRAVREGDRERLETGGGDELPPHGSRKEPHPVSVVDDLDGAVLVSQ